MADKVYTFDIANGGFDEAEKMLEKIEYYLLSEHFYKYMAKLLKKQLKKIQRRKLSTINSNEDIKASTYMNSNHLEMGDGYIYIYNDAKIDISDKNMSETTKANYPAQLSLAKIVEYGIGYTGSLGANSEVEDWEYDVNHHGYQGWYYKDNNGEVHWTNGFVGRYVFLELKRYIEENITQIMSDYLDDMFKKK